MECMAEDYIDHSPAGARSNADAVGIVYSKIKVPQIGK